MSAPKSQPRGLFASWCGFQQVLRLAGPLRQSERAQSLDPSRFLVGRPGEGGDCGRSRSLPAARLSSINLQDAGRQRGGGESGKCLTGPAPGGSPGAMEGKPSSKGQGFQQPLGTHQHWHVDISLPQSGGCFLVALQRAGRLQHRAFTNVTKLLSRSGSFMGSMRALLAALASVPDPGPTLG